MDFSLLLQQWTQAALSFFVFGALFCSILSLIFLPTSFHPSIRRAFPSAPKQGFIAMLLAFFAAIISLNVVNSAWFTQSFNVASKTNVLQTNLDATLEEDPFKSAYVVPNEVNLYFASVPSGADIYFNDEYMGKTPLEAAVTRARKFHYAIVADPKTYTPYASRFSAEKDESLSIHTGLLTDELTSRLEDEEHAALVPEQQLFVQTIDYSQETQEITAKLHNDTEIHYNYAFVSFRTFAEDGQELEPLYKLVYNIKSGERYSFSLNAPEAVAEVKLLSVLPLSPY